MSFSPLLSKRISQNTDIPDSPICKTLVFSSTYWYSLILVPWMLNLKRSHRDFLNFLLPPPPTSCGVLSQMLTLTEKSQPWPGYRQHASSTSWCELSFSWSSFMMAHFHSFNRSNLSSQWRFISGNLLYPKYMLSSISFLIHCKMVRFKY